MATLKQFIAANRIRASVDYADSNPNMPDSHDMNHYTVVLRMGRRQFTVAFSQGYGISREPCAADVLNCLALDASGYDNACGFEDWASEYGYDPDSRTAERVYKAVERSAVKLQRFLGEALYHELLWDTELD